MLQRWGVQQNNLVLSTGLIIWIGHNKGDSRCKLRNRWHWLRYRWNDQWSWWIAWARYFLNVTNERTYLHRARTYLKVPGWSLVWNALLTIKVIYVLLAFEWHALCKKLYISETGRRLGDRSREYLRDVEKDDKNASKLVLCNSPPTQLAIWKQSLWATLSQSGLSNSSRCY